MRVELNTMAFQVVVMAFRSNNFEARCVSDLARSH